MTQVKTLDPTAFDDLEEFEETPERVPYCQVINPDNLSEAKIRDLNIPYGLFIPKEQAISAGFTPNGDFKEHSHTFSPDSAEPAIVEGYLATHVRFCIISRSSTIEVQELTSRGWVYKGPGYIKGEPTPLKTLVDNDSNTYRLRTRYLLLFVDSQNTPLHKVPFQLSLGAGTGGAFGSEVKFFREDFNQVYGEVKNKPGITLSNELHSCTVLDIEIGFHKPNGRSPFIAPRIRLKPTKDGFGQKEVKSRRERQVTLVNEPYSRLLISKKSGTRELIFALREAYSQFPYPKKSKNEGESFEYSQRKKTQEANNDQDYWEKATPTPNNKPTPVQEEETEPIKEAVETNTSEEEEDSPIPF